jgi:hypothetical protein
VARPTADKPDEPAADIQGALSRLASTAAAPPAAPEADAGIAGAVASYATTAAQTQLRVYRVRDVAVVLGVFAALMVAFDAEGLALWARRMDVGPTQSAWLAVLSPLQRGTAAVGLGAGRSALLALSDRLALALGAGEDPLFVDAWRTEADLASELKFPAADSLDGILEAEPDLPAVPLPSPEAAALDPEPPSGPAEPAAADVRAAGSQATVLLVGDSLLAGSLSGAITRALARDSRVRVVQAVQSATGLSRPDVFDWMKVVPPLLEREKPQFIICSFGANDAQSIRQNGKLLEFGDAEWAAAYRDRVLAMMRALAGDKTRVLWLGLPPMRDPRMSARARALNRIFAWAPRKAPRVEYLELSMLIAGPDGEFATFVSDREGRFVRLRMEDGVHYAPAGSRAIAAWVVDWVYERLPKARRAP